MKLKYVMGVYGPVIFPETYTHSDIAEGIRGEIKSAGFLFITYDRSGERFESYPHGESISLSLRSDPERDKIIIDKFLNQEF
jgi:hypothetical protein